MQKAGFLTTRLKFISALFVAALVFLATGVNRPCRINTAEMSAVNHSARIRERSSTHENTKQVIQNA